MTYDEYRDEDDRRPGTVTVFHTSYGCDTGCMGHRIAWDGGSKFVWETPYDEDKLEWAKELVRTELGEAHVADLDWENCWISEDYW